MPNRDGTGPNGQGPMTGNRKGNCQNNNVSPPQDTQSNNQLGRNQRGNQGNNFGQGRGQWRGQGRNRNR